MLGDSLLAFSLAASGKAHSLKNEHHPLIHLLHIIVLQSDQPQLSYQTVEVGLHQLLISIFFHLVLKGTLVQCVNEL